MRAKGYLVGDWNVFTQGTEVTVDLLPVYEEQIQKEYLHKLLMATIEEVVCKEYLEFFEDVLEWDDYIQQLMSCPEELFRAFVTGDIQSDIEQKAEEVWEDNKPKYYPVDVKISVHTRIYVKATNSDKVDNAMGYCVDAEEIIDNDVPTYEIEDYSICEPEDEPDRLYSVYDADEEQFI